MSQALLEAAVKQQEQGCFGVGGGQHMAYPSVHDARAPSKLDLKIRIMQKALSSISSCTSSTEIQAAAAHGLTFAASQAMHSAH